NSEPALALTAPALPAPGPQLFVAPAGETKIGITPAVAIATAARTEPNLGRLMPNPPVSRLADAARQHVFRARREHGGSTRLPDRRSTQTSVFGFPLAAARTRRRRCRPCARRAVSAEGHHEVQRLGASGSAVFHTSHARICAADGRRAYPGA